MTRTLNVAVVLAGGTGRRLGGDAPKQFRVMAGRTILEHSVRAFALHDGIDEVCVVSHADYVDEVRRLVAPYAKARRVVAGGAERYDSSLAAIRTYGEVERATGCRVNLLLHDAARPLVGRRVVADCLAALSGGAQAVDVAIPAVDTVVEVDADGCIAAIPSRSRLRAVQTPQCFPLAVIAEAYARGLRDPDFAPTDDCSVVHRYMPEVKIRIVAGEATNIKVTYPSDLVLAESLLAGGGE